MKVYIYGDEVILHNYSAAIQHYGASAIVSTQIELANVCEALLLAGGGDIAPHRYGQEDKFCRQIDVQRDEDELQLFASFVKDRKPILGICRGLQLINVAMGGDLTQHLPEAERHQWCKESGDQAHLIKTYEGTFLHKVFGETCMTNSAHHQGINRLAPNLRISAISTDGVIEAIEALSERIYGVQFHPERMMLAHFKPDIADGSAIIQYFLKAVSQ